jgi:hypothetical protein
MNTIWLETTTGTLFARFVDIVMRVENEGLDFLGGKMSETKIPGLAAKHAIVTPVCRQNKTYIGALDEAVERLRQEYISCTQVLENQDAIYHFVLTVERPDIEADKEWARTQPHAGG